MDTLLVFIVGLIVGSFLNVVISRLHHGGSIIFGRSHCVHCRHELAAKDLIPLLSFLWLRGNCRYCSKKISWQYPAVELLTAIAFAIISITSALSPITYVFVCFLIIIGTFDLKHYLILDKVLLPFGALAILWNIINGGVVAGLLSGLAVSAFFAIQYFVSRGTWIGFGDVKFGFVLGNLLGWPGSLVGLFLAYLIGAVTGLGLIAVGKKRLSSQLPMGTFLSISAIITMLYGRQIADWYFHLIGF